MKDNRKTIQILTILTIIFTIIGGSLAYWTWESENSTNITFSIGGNFSCAADGGGNITQTDAAEMIAPSACTNELYAIKREITVTPTITKDGLSMYMDLWLDIKNIGSGLSGSKNFKYVLSTSSSSCEGDAVVNSGTFYGKEQDDTVILFDRKVYTGTGTTLQPETYYLYIWLDAEETSSSTMGQAFNFVLNGNCTDNPGTVPEAPVLDESMIPVTIADNGNVTTVSPTDTSWYDYNNQKWANIVLVNESATEGVDDSQPREYYLDNLSNNVPVTEEDILAYYVWIPRYKYRIPGNKCSTIPEEERNIDDYPECYAPYTMSEEDITDETGLYQYYKFWYACTTNSYYCTGSGENKKCYEEEALNGFNNAFETGYFEDNTSLVSFVNEFNQLGAIAEVDDAGTCAYASLRGVTLIPSEFNGDNIIHGPSSIDIVFESPKDNMVTGDAVDTYYSHPGFWWDNNSNNVVDSGETLSGIWVGKFEMSGELDGIHFIPDGQMLPNKHTAIALSRLYNGHLNDVGKRTSKNDNAYGLNHLTTNSHQMKNSEWGSVAYLTHSKYGINTNVAENKYLLEDIVSFKTGCGYSEDGTICANEYGTVSSYPQSTTGNITGIFDMSGANTERVAVYSSKSSTIPTLLAYQDYYSAISPLTACNGRICYGHALSETNGWYGTSTSLNDDEKYTNIDRYNLFGNAAHSDDSGGTLRSVLINGFASGATT